MEEVFMIWIFALPGLLLSVVPLMVGLGFTYGLCRVMRSIFKHMKRYFETRYQPQVIYLDLSDDEIKRRYRNMDNREKGYNPFRHDYAMIELFPGEPKIAEIKEAAKKLFPRRHHQLVSAEKNVYRAAHALLLNMLIERRHQINTGRWSDEQEGAWLAVPYLPTQMREIDDVYLDWIFASTGYKDTELLAG